MRRSLTGITLVAVGLVALAAKPVQRDALTATPSLAAPSEAQTILSAQSELPLKASFTSPQALSCRQSCDADYVRTHQMCLATISGLKTPDAPDTQACDRAARVGIQHCQKQCETNATSMVNPKLDPVTDHNQD